MRNLFTSCLPWIKRPLSLCFFVCLTLIWGGNLAIGQVTVEGKVADEATGDALIGARVLVQGIPAGGMTDEKGKFTFKAPQAPPFTLVVTYIGYDTLEYQVTSVNRPINLTLNEIGISVGEVEIVASAAQDRQKQSPLSVESMSINAIKETPAASFYDGIGHLKGVDLTAASIGFKVINTRGFASAAPVRSLQIIDGVDNQAPGLNFALGNFLGASELDVQSVDLIVGASSAFYGPNAFNGVISMNTKDPFVHRGLSVMAKVGERNMGEFAIRYARVFQNKKKEDKFAFKLNAYYLTVDDWEADNLDPVDGANEGRDNPGGYDAVNRYGDENLTAGQNNQTTPNGRGLYPGLGRWHRTGYEEIDLVDYDTRNIKLNAQLGYKITPKIELVLASSFANGTTVLQGDNRYSLRDILFYQNRIELKQNDKFFLRAYATNENAGNSYDAVFTAYQLQSRVKRDDEWTVDYNNYWSGAAPRSTLHPLYITPTVGVNGRQLGINGRVMALPGFPAQQFPYDFDRADSVLALHLPQLFAWHDSARLYADTENFSRLVPGTPEYQELFEEITSTPLAQGGTQIVDRSALYHVHGEYHIDNPIVNVIVGASGRLYTPVSEGNIFSDSLTTIRDTSSDGSITTRKELLKIRNYEVGGYLGLEKRLIDDRLRLNATLRLDKNQNFNVVGTYSASVVWEALSGIIFRAALSSAVRNPTLQDQYLYYNVGRALLVGNLDGYSGLADTSSLRRFFTETQYTRDSIQYFSIDPIQPEKVQTAEVGIRATIGKRIYVDANYYYSRYRDFIGYNIGVDLRFSPLFPENVISAQALRVAANATETVTTQGVAVGVNYFFDKGYTFNGNYSWNRLNSDSDDPIIPAYNTPEHKFNVGFSGRDITVWKIKHAGFSVNYKWIQGYLFEGSPQFTGAIPTYDMLDVQINKYVPKIKSTFKLGASNILNNKVFQIYGGPRVGRLAYFSITTNLENL